DKPLKHYPPKSGITVWVGETPRTSTVVLLATLVLKGSGGAASVAEGGVMRVYNFEDTMAPVTCPLTRGAKLKEAPLTQAHISLMRISSSTLDYFKASRN
ncbi:hypothetical protein HAX54_048455, partial [Datura stramonium]|nr:hypothetical protein [Datura stramonium]